MSDLVIIIDTREQRPYFFPEFTTAPAALPAGDYSIQGWEKLIAVERKTLSDYIGSISQGRKRFMRELQKLQSYWYACIVVEANMEDIFNNDYRSKMNQNAVIGTTISIYLRYGIPTYFCSHRIGGRQFTERFLIKAAENAKAKTGGE